MKIIQFYLTLIIAHTFFTTISLAQGNSRNENQATQDSKALDFPSFDFSKTDNIFLFPNPSTGNFSIFTTLQAKGTALPYQVLNVQGSLIESGIGENQRQTKTHLKPGIYLIRIKILEAWHTKKLIIE